MHNVREQRIHEVKCQIAYVDKLQQFRNSIYSTRDRCEVRTETVCVTWSAGPSDSEWQAPVITVTGQKIKTSGAPRKDCRPATVKLLAHAPDPSLARDSDGMWHELPKCVMEVVKQFAPTTAPWGGAAATNGTETG